MEIDRDFVALQARTLRKRLKGLSIADQITVNTTPEVRDAMSFKDRRTLAYTSLDEIPVAIIASIGAKRISVPKYPVVGMLIPPAREASGLLVDDKTNAVYTDGFWECRNGEFKYVTTTSPVPIDGWDVAFDHSRDDPSLQPHFKTHNALFEITGDKNRTREVLAKAGVEIPRGMLLDVTPNVKADVQNFLAQNQDVNGLVMKALHGAQGSRVWLYDLGRVEQLVWDAQHGHFSKYVLEERIIPAPAPQGLRGIARFNGVENPDYNFRVITSLGHDPIIVASEIRYQEMGNKPVNISQSAKAARLNELGDLTLTRRINEVAKDAIKAVCAEVLPPGEHMLGIGGGDLMWSITDSIPVLEVNSGMVGGFGTLCRFDRSPLAKIRDALIPAYKPYLEEHFAQRAETPGELRRVAHSGDDLATIFNFFTDNGKYQEAEEYILDNGDKFSPISVSNSLIWLGHRMGMVKGLAFLDKAIDNNPDNLRLKMQRNKLREELD